MPTVDPCEMPRHGLTSIMRVERQLPSQLGEQLAQLALTCTDATLPVNLDNLAAALGVQSVRVADLHEDGRTTWVGGRPHIEVRADRTPQRQRFTLAHELAHVLLANNRETDVRLRTKSFDQPAEERLCDWIAAAILMPLAWVQPLAARPMTLSRLRAIATSADTSLSAAAVRVSEVGRRPCMLLRWRRSPRGQWVLVGMAGVPTEFVGKTSVTGATHDRLEAVSARSMRTEVELAIDGVPIEVRSAEVCLRGGTLLMLITEALRPAAGRPGTS